MTFLLLLLPCCYGTPTKALPSNHTSHSLQLVYPHPHPQPYPDSLPPYSAPSSAGQMVQAVPGMRHAAYPYLEGGGAGASQGATSP